MAELSEEQVESAVRMFTVNCGGQWLAYSDKKRSRFVDAFRLVVPHVQLRWDGPTEGDLVAVLADQGVTARCQKEEEEITGLAEIVLNALAAFVRRRNAALNAKAGRSAQGGRDGCSRILPARLPGGNSINYPCRAGRGEVMHKLHKLHFDLDIKYSREADYSKDNIRKSIEKLLQGGVGDSFGAYVAIRKVEVK